MAKFVALLEFTDQEELRLQTRPTHRDDTGAMLIYEVADMAEAQRLLDAEPYRTAGVIANARIKEWRVVMGPFAAE
jgi:uncharacterized protein YciI